MASARYWPTKDNHGFDNFGPRRQEEFCHVIFGILFQWLVHLVLLQRCQSLGSKSIIESWLFLSLILIILWLNYSRSSAGTWTATWREDIIWINPSWRDTWESIQRPGIKESDSEPEFLAARKLPNATANSCKSTKGQLVVSLIQ